MNEPLTYLLQVHASLLLVYLLHKLAFSRDTFCTARRIYLAGALVFSFAYPVIPLPLEFATEPMHPLAIGWSALPAIAAAPADATQPLTLAEVPGLLYGLVCTALAVRLVIQLLSVLRLRRQSKPVARIGRVTVRCTDEACTPFSFGKSIYLNSQTYRPGDHLHEILAHEYAHIRQGHMLDLLLAEAAAIACWCNPAAWLLRHEVRLNLEYLADEAVVRQGADRRRYQYHLLHTALPDVRLNIIQPFNVSHLKKRIVMMNKTPTRRAGLAKYLLALPLAAALVAAAQTENLAAADRPQPAHAPTAADTLPGNDPAKQPPAFPGGDEAAYRYIAQRIKYPAEAQQKGEQGRVVVEFTIRETGEVADAQVVQSASPSLDREALRIVNAMPHWRPARDGGKAVSVRHSLPVVFAFEGEQPQTGENDVVVIAYRHDPQARTNSMTATVHRDSSDTDPGTPTVFAITSTGGDTVQRPLIVVDKRVMDATFNINSIPAERIVQVEVLTDQSATDAYGPQGRNGVIVVTTKRE